MNNNILIVGTGALATLFAARLNQAGHRITMLGTWQEGISALHKNGARIIDTDGHEKQFEVHATNDPRECVGAKYALVLVKAWQTERAAKQLVECLTDDGLAVTLQNGLGNYETLSLSLGLPSRMICLANHVPPLLAARTVNRVALGSTTTGATLLEAGLVRAGGEGVISIGRHQALGPVEAALRSAKFNVQVVDDAQSLVWGKLVVNAAINPLTALLRVPNGELLERPSAREMMGVLAREVADVARAENIQLPFNDPIAMAEDVARKTAANHSSMLQDVIRNAPTEIDAICGAVVQIAKIHNMETPANWACWLLVRALGN